MSYLVHHSDCRMNHIAAVTAAVVTKVTLSTLQKEGFYRWSFLVYVFNMDLLQAKFCTVQKICICCMALQTQGSENLLWLLVCVNTHNGQWHSTMTFWKLKHSLIWTLFSDYECICVTMCLSSMNLYLHLCIWFKLIRNSANASWIMHGLKT